MEDEVIQPIVIWEQGDYRVVWQQETEEDSLIAERRAFDAMKAPAWRQLTGTVDETIILRRALLSFVVGQIGEHSSMLDAPGPIDDQAHDDPSADSDGVQW